MTPLHDPRFAPPLLPPFPAGTSPFRQKGNGYIGDRRCLDATVPGGFRAALATVSDPGTRAFFEQRFAPSEWYDAYPGALLEVGVARLRGVSFEEQRRGTGAWHAREATRGVYSTLIKLASNVSVALWGPRLSSVYFEFGRMETRPTANKEVTAIRRGVPAELAQAILWSSIGFCHEALLLAGARSPVVDVLAVEPDGREHGRELVKVTVRIRWS